VRDCVDVDDNSIRMDAYETQFLAMRKNTMNQERKIARLAEAMRCFIEAHGKSGCSMVDMRGCYSNHSQIDQSRAIRELLETNEVEVSNFQGQSWIRSTEFCR